MTQQEIEAMRQRIASLELEKKHLKDAIGKQLSFKVSTKGAVSAYGMGRFPVTLYKAQWDKLIKAMPALEVFLKDNNALLAVKA